MHEAKNGEMPLVCSPEWMILSGVWNFSNTLRLMQQNKTKHSLGMWTAQLRNSLHSPACFHCTH